MRPEDEDEPLLEGCEGPGDLPRGIFEVPTPPEGLREAVLKRTLGVVVARRRRRRFGMVLGLVLVYSAGILTTRLFPAKVMELPGARPVARETSVASITPAEPADLLRSVIDAPPEERPRLLREAGDLYLSARGDVESALHCYRQVLELSKPSERRRPEAGDTWLLAVLKDGQGIKSRR